MRCEESENWRARERDRDRKPIMERKATENYKKGETKRWASEVKLKIKRIRTPFFSNHKSEMIKCF